MRWPFLPLLTLAFLVLSCKDPNAYAPDDPELTDPPAAPQLLVPEYDWMGTTVYPQSVSFSWQRVAGAQKYHFQVFSDSVLSEANLYLEQTNVSDPGLTVEFFSFDQYFWRVRGVSSNWRGGYTNWSAVWRFRLPNPGGR